MGTISTKEKQRLKRFVRQLDKVRGRHTELVSVYIPADYDMNKIIQHLAQEQGTAANIKDKTTRTHVIDSLERMIQHLRLFKKTPDNGLAVFSGDMSTVDGRPDIQVFSIEPPLPLKMRLYRCDQTFVLDILRDMLEVKDMFGLIVLDKRDAILGFLKGTQIQEVTELGSGVPGKTRAGGQCLHPETPVLLADEQYVLLEEINVGDEVMSYDFNTKTFIPSKVLKQWETNKEEVYHIETNNEEISCSSDHLFFLPDGSTMAAEDLSVGDPVLGEDANQLVITKIRSEERKMPFIDITVEKGNFVAAGFVVHNSAQRFARIREEAAKEFFTRIGEAANHTFLEMKDLKGILVGGPGHTKNQFLDLGYLNQQLHRLVISIQDLSYTGSFGLRELVEKSRNVLAKEAIVEEQETIQEFLKLLSTQPNKVAYGEKEVEKALEMGAVEKLIVSETVDDAKMEFYEDKSEESGTILLVVSTDTSEGEQLQSLGKVAAILRFPIH